MLHATTLSITSARDKAHSHLTHKSARRYQICQLMLIHALGAPSNSRPSLCILHLNTSLMPDCWINILPEFRFYNPNPAQCDGIALLLVCGAPHAKLQTDYNARIPERNICAQPAIDPGCGHQELALGNRIGWRNMI